MNENTKLIYNTVYKNAVLFLKKGIKEIIKHDNAGLKNNQAIFSCLYIQMSIELGLKSFLIKDSGIRTILLNKYENRTEDEIFASFNANTLQTKRFEDLKNFIKKNYSFFDEAQYNQINKLQLYRNKLVHLNLFLDDNELVILKNELIYTIVHILIPFLTEISFEFETPSEFYQECLNKKQYKKLISFAPYVDEMEKLAKNNDGLAYECPNCFKHTFSPISEICYCCNLKFIDAAGYVDCKQCEAKKSVIYDVLNIEDNNNSINSKCLNCGDKSYVFRCPECEFALTYYFENELENTCFGGCKIL